MKTLAWEEGGLYSFYRSIYKGTDCGPTVGFLINGEWKYCSELPKDFPNVEAVHISSIVEGSDVETDSYQIYEKDFTEDEFWAKLEEVNAEADFYWKRDNTDWFCIYKDDKLVTTCHKGHWDSKVTWDCPEYMPEAIRKIIEKAIHTRGEEVSGCPGIYTDPLGNSNEGIHIPDTPSKLGINLPQTVMETEKEEWFEDYKCYYVPIARLGISVDDIKPLFLESKKYRC